MNFDFAFYRGLVWRRLPLMMLFVLLCSGLGIIAALKLPETFYTTARLLVEPPRISEDLIRSNNPVDAVEQLDIVEQKLLTRSNLIDIANRYEVYEDIRDIEPDLVEERMRENTKIRRFAGRDRATVMTLGFEARSGRIAADVVNEYVTLVLDENKDTQSTRAESTREFFEQEVNRLSQELDRQSAAIATFKSENAAALPEDQSYRLNRQTSLQETVSRLERDMAATEARRRDIVSIYENTGSVTQSTQAQESMSPQEQQLIVAQAELDAALSTYSDSHPRVIRLKNRVDRLEKVVANLKNAAVPTSEGAEPVTQEEAYLKATLAEIDNRLEFIRGDIDAAREELEELQLAISRSSANGIELAGLEREYESIQARYNSAVNNLNQAQMDERIEDTGQGQRISVIESANVPTIPAGPNRPKIAILGVAAGIFLAGGYFMLLEFLNRAIRRPAELVNRFNITPITTIPYMESRGRRIVRRSGLVTALLAVLVGVPAVLWYVDTNYLPLEIVVQKGLAKLGLG